MGQKKTNGQKIPRNDPKKPEESVKGYVSTMLGSWPQITTRTSQLPEEELVSYFLILYY